MVLRTLKEVMNKDIIGIQSSNEPAIILELIMHSGTVKAEKLWEEGKDCMIANRPITLKKAIDKEEAAEDKSICATVKALNNTKQVWDDANEHGPVYVMVTNLTKPVDELSLKGISLSTFSEYCNYKPLVVFHVS